MLAPVDWLIIGGYLGLSIAIGLILRGKAKGSKEDYFLSGRSLPWWLIGTSMAATNFAADAPLAIAGIVSKEGIAGLWFKWSALIAAAFAIFVFSRLWRRAYVITDAELVELRYSGASAKWLRLIKALYFGVVLNAFIMGWVMVAMTKIMFATVGWSPVQTLLVFSGITLSYTLISGFWGVVVTDFIQYFISLTASIVLAVMSLRYVGGMDSLKSKLSLLYGESNQILKFLPRLSNNAEELNSVGTISLTSFLVYVLIQWWAQKYADGGGKHIQRMSAAKNETHALFGSYWFALLTYALQMWPWIVTSVVALVVFPGLSDPELGYPKIIMEVMPPGLLGLALLSLISAFMSTIDTHLNLGAAYVANDVYARFIHPTAPDKTIVIVSKCAIVVQLLIASLIAMQIESIANTWKFVIAFSSGAGATLVMRWLWWRINAWSELVSMLASGLSATCIKLWYPNIEHGHLVLFVVSISTVAWLFATFVTPAVDDKTLVAFFERVRPPRLLWKRIAVQASHEERLSSKGISIWVNLVLGMCSLGLICFGVGVMIFGRFGFGTMQTLLGVVLGAWLVVREAQHPSLGARGAKSEGVADRDDAAL